MKKHKDFWEVTEDSLDKSMKVFKIQSSMRNELLDLYKILSVFPEVLGVLEDLKKRKFRLCILSNGTPALLNELLKINNLNDFFDNVFSVEQVGVYKPDSRVYDIPLKKYKIKKKEVVFLSANTWDISGGGNFGYNTIWVNRNNNVFDNLDFIPKNQIVSLKGLLDILK